MTLVLVNARLCESNYTMAYINPLKSGKYIRVCQQGEFTHPVILGFSICVVNIFHKMRQDTFADNVVKIIYLCTGGQE